MEQLRHAALHAQASSLRPAARGLLEGQLDSAPQAIHPQAQQVVAERWEDKLHGPIVLAYVPEAVDGVLAVQLRGSAPFPLSRGSVP